MKKFIILVMAMGFIAGCEVNPSKFGNEEAKEFASKITYVKDTRTNLCFALVASRKTADFNQTGMGISAVSCDAVAELLK